MSNSSRLQLYCNWYGTITGAEPYLRINDRTLADTTDDAEASCSNDGVGGGEAGSGKGTVGGGEMARRLITPTVTQASGAVVELNTAGPFTFDKSNTTDVIDSDVFNANYQDKVINGQCDGEIIQTATTHFNMFSRQLLNGVTGITVSEGNSLSVKWTITAE